MHMNLGLAENLGLGLGWLMNSRANSPRSASKFAAQIRQHAHIHARCVLCSLLRAQAARAWPSSLTGVCFPAHMHFSLLIDAVSTFIVHYGWLVWLNLIIRNHPWLAWLLSPVRAPLGVMNCRIRMAVGPQCSCC